MAITSHCILPLLLNYLIVLLAIPIYWFIWLVLHVPPLKFLFFLLFKVLETVIWIIGNIFFFIMQIFSRVFGNPQRSQGIREINTFLDDDFRLCSYDKDIIMSQAAKLAYETHFGVNYHLSVTDGWRHLGFQLDPLDPGTYTIPQLNGHILDTDFFIARRVSDGKNECIIAFRGTEGFDFLDWMTDFAFNTDLSQCSSVPGRLHTGFQAALGLLSHQKNSSLYEALCSKLEDVDVIYVCGHSLGGALATVFSAHLLFSDRLKSHQTMDIATFGAPCVGNLQFCQAFDRKISRMSNVTFARYVNGNDLVPRVPPMIQVPCFTSLSGYCQPSTGFIWIDCFGKFHSQQSYPGLNTQHPPLQLLAAPIKLFLGVCQSPRESFVRFLSRIISLGFDLTTGNVLNINDHMPGDYTRAITLHYCHNNNTNDNDDEDADRHHLHRD